MYKGDCRELDEGGIYMFLSVTSSAQKIGEQREHIFETHYCIEAHTIIRLTTSINTSGLPYLLTEQNKHWGILTNVNLVTTLYYKLYIIYVCTLFPTESVNISTILQPPFI